MNNRNTTLFALNALPASPQALMDFYCLQHLRCKPLESAYIQPPSEWTAHGPEGNVFQYPIQVTVLGIHNDHVDLGLYAHPSLLVQQGPKPNRLWRRKWRKAPFLKYNHTKKPSISNALLHLCDEYHRLQYLHCFIYDAVEELLHREDGDYEPKMLNGLNHLLRWLREQDQVFFDQLDQLLQAQ